MAKKRKDEDEVVDVVSTADDTGAEGDDDFDDPDTTDPIPMRPSEEDQERKQSKRDANAKAAKAKSSSSSTPSGQSKLAKAVGLKSSDCMSYNEKTRVGVFTNGGKYQLSKDGKSARRLAGPQPAAATVEVTDATTRGFVGDAALTNAPASVDEESQDAKRARRAELEAELEALNEEIEEDGDEEDEEE